MGWFMGATAGLLFAGPLGAVVGGVLQHMATKSFNGQAGQPGQMEHKAEALFVTNLVAIITKVAMADGHVSEDEKAAIHHFFSDVLNYRGEDLSYIDAMINETQTQNPPLEPVCAEFLRYSNAETRILLLNILYEVAYTDEKLTESEQEEISRIAVYLRIPPGVHASIKSKYQGTTSVSRAKKDHFSVLGIDKGASNEEIKKAYRTLAAQYHPDKVSHLGKELIDFANKKISEINTAYSDIKKQRGL